MSEWRSLRGTGPTTVCSLLHFRGHPRANIIFRLRTVGENNRDCLCESCELAVAGGYAPRGPDSDSDSDEEPPSSPRGQVLADPAYAVLLQRK